MFLFFAEPAFAQQGVFFREEALNQAIAKSLPAYFNHFFAEISDSITSEIRENTKTPIAIQIDREISIFREYFGELQLQKEIFSEISEKKDFWMSEIRKAYLDSRLIDQKRLELEMKDWEKFFESLQNLDFEKAQALVDDFTQRRLTGSGRLGERRQNFVPDQIPLFKTRRSLLLNQIEQGFRDEISKSEQGEWIQGSLINWELILKELEEWSLLVDFDVQISPKIETVDLAPSFSPNLPQAQGAGSVKATAEIAFKRLSLSFVNRRTDEKFEISSDLVQSSETAKMRNPESPEFIWNLNRGIELQADGAFTFDPRRTDQIEINESLENHLQPINIEIGPVRTNFKEIQVEHEGVSEVLSQIFNRNEIASAISRASLLPLFDKFKLQIQDDVKNLLKNKMIDISIIIFQDEEGEAKFEAALKNEKSEQRVEDLKAQGRFVTQIVSQTSLTLDDFEMSFDTTAQAIDVKVRLPQTKMLSSRIDGFDFPRFLFTKEENSLVGSLMNYFDQSSMDLSEARLEADLRLSSSEDNLANLTFRLPIKWAQSPSSAYDVPRIAAEEMSMNLDEIANAKIGVVRFRSTDKSPWVRLDFQDQMKIQDQLYRQMKNLNQNFKDVTGEEFENFFHRELTHRLQKMVLRLGSEETSSDSSSTEENLRILDFQFPAEAVRINWEAAEELRKINAEMAVPLLRRRSPDAFKSVFEKLPKEYRPFKMEPGMVVLRTDLSLPQNFRIELQNIDDEDAFIEAIQLSVASEQAQTASVFWKVHQDAQGRLVILPEISNLESVISGFKPVLDSSDPAQQLLFRGVQPKGFWARGAEWITQSLRESGNARVATLGWIGQGQIERKKRDRIAAKIQESFHQKLQEKLPDLTLDLLKAANGYVLEPMGNGQSPRMGFDPQAVMPALQRDFENIVEGLVDRRRLREGLSQWRFDSEGPSALHQLETEVRAAATQVPSESFGAYYENLVQSVSDTLINAPNIFQSVIEGEYQPETRVPEWIRNPNPVPSPGVERPTNLNSLIQGLVPFLKEQVNQFFIEMKIPQEVTESFAQRSQSSDLAASPASPRAPDTIFFLPDHFCIPQNDRHLGEIFEHANGLVSSPSRTLPIYAFHGSQGGSLMENHVSEDIQEMLQKHLSLRAWPEDDPQRVQEQTPDGMAFMSLEGLSESLIRPNLDEFKRYIREMASLQKPGTELSLNDMNFELREVRGEWKPVVRIKMRLKHKKGLIRFDSGRDREGKEDFEFLLPVTVGLSNLFDGRPEFDKDEWNSGYGLQLSFDYPVEFTNPNFHDFVDEWIKKELAFPELIEAFVFESAEGDRRSRTRKKRVMSVHLPQTLGMPLVMKDAPIEMRNISFDRTAAGDDFALVGFKFGEFRQNYPTRAPFILHMDSPSLRASVEGYYSDNDFYFEEDAMRLLHGLVDRSKERRRAFHNDKSLSFNLKPGGPGIIFDENDKGYVQFEILLNSQDSQWPESLRVQIPFQVYQANGQWVLDADPAVRVEASSEGVNSEALRSLINFFKETNPDPLILHGFQMISKPSEDD